MIDFHNHILPNTDDGSTSLEMSIEMLVHAANQGITDVVNTVHYKHPKVDGHGISFKKIESKIKKLQAEVNRIGIPIRLHIGSEVFYSADILNLIDDPLATMGNNNYMLIEFHPQIIPNDHRKILFELKMLGVTPIIAHPERYNKVQKDINIVHSWLEAGCLIQVDGGSILGYLGHKAKIASETIIKQNWCQILGSDAHNNKNRNFLLKESLKVVESFIGEKSKC
jgi:Capsular polysaccharide biosynthesis protein